MSCCQNCFSKINEKDIFCGNCGVKIVKNEIDYYKKILNSFDGILIAMLSKLSKIDGRICSAESEYISKLFTLLIATSKYENLPNIREIYKKILNNEKNNLDNIYILCEKLKQLAIPEKDKIFVIEILLELAHIDSTYDEDEENFIVKIVHYLDLDFKIYQNIKNKYSKSESNNNESNEKKQSNKNSFNGKLSLKESFEILELNENAINTEIKKQYRNLAKQYHYDSMVSKNLPKDMIDFAEEKSKMINAAYEVIKKNKGI